MVGPDLKYINIIITESTYLVKLSIGFKPHFFNMVISSSQPLHIVVNILLPVKIALTPLMKHKNCSCSFMVYRPAANLMMDSGIINLAVAIVLKIASNSNCLSFGAFFNTSTIGVPWIGTNLLIGNDSGCGLMLDKVYKTKHDLVRFLPIREYHRYKL